MIASVLFALSVIVTPAFAACDLAHLTDPVICDEAGLLELAASLGATSPTTTTTTTGSMTGIPAGFQFTQSLTVGSTGTQVKYLQILLNSDSATAVGNAGNETSYFGSMTKAAVIKFQTKYASEVLAPLGLTNPTGYWGASSRAKANALLAGGISTGGFPAGCTSTSGYSTVTGLPCSSTGTLPAGCTSTIGYSPTTGQKCDSGSTTPVTGGFSIRLATDNPASGTFVQGQATADLAHYIFSNGTATAVNVTGVELTRLGISADATLSNVYLFDGATRLTDAASVSAGKVTFNATAGLFTIPANSTMTIVVKSDLADTTSGQTVGVSLSGVTSNGTLSGTTLPIAGNIHSIASATLASVAVGTITPSATGTVNAGVQNYTVFSAPLTIGTRTVSLKGLLLKMIGSIPTDALEGLQLYVNGVATGSPINLTSEGLAVFSLATPVSVQSGAATVEVRANVVKGSSRNFAFSLENAADLVVIDSVYNVNVTPTGTPQTTATISINAGSVSVTTDATFSPSGLTSGVSNTILAKYNFKAYGEDVKVTYLDVTPSLNIDNVIIYANGAPITSSQNYTGTKLSFSLGSSLIIPANTTVSVEVRGDTKAASVAMPNGTNVTITLNTRTNNAQGVSSSTLSSAPGSDIAAPTLQVGTGTLALAVSSSFPTTGNITPNTNNQKIGSYVVQSGSADGVRINNISVALGGTLPVTSLSDLYVKYGTEQSAYVVSPQASNNFSTSIQLQPSTPLTIDVYANIGSLGTVVNAADTQTNTAAETTPSANGVAASQTAVFAGTATTGQNSIITVAGFPTTLAETTGETAIQQATAMVALFNANTNVNGQFIASNVNGTSATVTIAAKVAGVAANGTTITRTVGTGSTITLGGATLAGGTASTAEISTITPANVEIGDVFTAVINGTSVSFTATAATVANVTAGLTAALNANSTIATAVTATDSTTHVTVTSDTAGTAGAFTMTSSAANGYHSALGSTVQATLGMSATGISSNTTVVPTPATLAGQTMTVAGISLATPTLMSSSPVQQFVLAGSKGSYLANYNFIATNGTATITELRFTTTNSGITNITVGGKTAPVVSNAATITGLSIAVPVGYSGLTVPVQVDYNTVGIGGGVASNVSTALTVTYAKYLAGTTTTVNSPISVASRTMYVVGAIPAANVVSSTRTGLTNTLVELGQVTVSATGGTIKLETLPINVTSTGAVTVANAGNNVTVKVDGITVGTTNTGLNVGAGASDEEVITFTTPYEITDGTPKTFVIYATAATSDGADDSLTTQLGSTKANFTWTDVEGNVAAIPGTNMYTYGTQTSVIGN